MSTKNLARTVIEGGRSAYNKFARRQSSSVERSHAHQLEGLLRRETELDSISFMPRQRVTRCFDDKLGPARRWLRSQVGKPWAAVRGALFERFDTRTTAGRHILFDHLLREVRASDDPESRHPHFWVDRHGILRHQPRERFSWGRRERLPESEATLTAWLDGRRVLAHGERLYWLDPTAHGGFRQKSELSPRDKQRFESLPAWFREQFTGAIRVPTAPGSPRSLEMTWRR
ncbi:MAG TPA: hypothetical protein VHM70_31090 [Polyangiaceae bacterium]|jgi:hypothetical protein|nr:hypothetical protein [Polyangiaceae bacterium]